MPSAEESRFLTEAVLDCYRTMLTIRGFEEKLGDLFSQGLLGGTSHFCIGQEACAVGVISETRATDYLISNHRGHGHLLARGLDPNRVMAELMGRLDGYCGGRGGSQHMCAMDACFLGTNGITGGGIPIGTGAAFALKYRGSDRVAVVFFGDGASNQGTFHESLNMASLWRLPALYVCENNGYGMSMPVSSSAACRSIAERAAAYAIRSEICDGMDVLAVKRRAAELLEHVRAGNGPALLELITYRFCGHSKNDARAYRTREEEAEWQARDCLVLTRRWLGANGVPATRIEDVEAAVRSVIDDAVAFAVASPVGGEAEAVGGVYA